jgi:hypothetical protein
MFRFDFDLISGGWLIYPALTDKFKSSIGLPTDDLLHSDVRYTNPEEDDSEKMPELK